MWLYRSQNYWRRQTPHARRHSNPARQHGDPERLRSYRPNGNCLVKPILHSQSLRRHSMKHQFSSISTKQSQCSCRLMQAALKLMVSSTSTIGSELAGRSTSIRKDPLLRNRTTLHTIGSSWSLWKWWHSDGINSRALIISCWFSATTIILSISELQKCSPGCRLGARWYYPHTPLLSNTWKPRRTQPMDHQDDPTLR